MMAETDTDQEPWRIWLSGSRSEHYGRLLYRRAVGDLPEMESAKEVARRVSAVAVDGMSVLDVGCGAGHYLRSLRAKIPGPFTYVGIDATPAYAALGRRAFDGAGVAAFVVGDIYDLPVASRSFDVVMCNNVLLHLPSIRRPLSELYRVTRRHLIVRTLIGDVTYRIKEARSDELDANDEPTAWHHLNIYARPVIARMLGDLGIARFTIEPDLAFDAARINQEGKAYDRTGVRTEVINGMQVGGHIVHPWAYLTITRG